MSASALQFWNVDDLRIQLVLFPFSGFLLSIVDHLFIGYIVLKRSYLSFRDTDLVYQTERRFKLSEK